MEYVSIEEAKEIFGINFIGSEEISLVADLMNLKNPSRFSFIPNIPFDNKTLLKLSKTHLLFLGVPFTSHGGKLTLMDMRSFYGMDSSVHEPCFYNQDWYVNEPFANHSTLEYKWYLLKKELIDETRGQSVKILDEDLDSTLPSAIVCAYAFFTYFYVSGIYLWKNDFVWCSDLDINDDRIYVGRYFDPQGSAKNGFSIHRHLRIKENYGQIEML